MSHYWDIHCKTCNSDLDVHWNHGGEVLTTFLRQDGPALIAKLADIHLAHYALETRFDCGPETNRDLIPWCKKHSAHELVVKDEYGSSYEDCAAYFRCPHCDQNLTCKLSRDHAGHHDNRKPDETD